MLILDKDLNMFKHKLLYLLLFLSTSLLSQKYNFVNWTVEDGLIQSQASSICQDKYRQLWIGTEGGICKFDGKKFTGYSVQEGLVANHINIIYCDQKSRIWIGTNYGISIFNGSQFKTLKIRPSGNNNATVFCEQNDSSMYLLNNFRPYHIKNFSPKRICISGDTNERVSTLTKCPDGSLLAYVFGKGLYSFGSGQSGRLIIEAKAEDQQSFVSDILIGPAKDTLLIMNNLLYKIINRKVMAYGSPLKNPCPFSVICASFDNQGKLWLGTDNGAYKLDGEKLIHFNSKSGFSDNSVNHILLDQEKNLWFATDADGIYKFRENTFTYYDQSSGLTNPIVMGVTQTQDGTIYAGGYGGGLYKLNKTGVLQAVYSNGPVLSDSKIYCLYADREDNVWIGTINKGIWKYNARKGIEQLNAVGQQEALNGATTFYVDLKGNLVIGSNQGLFVKEKNGALTRIKIQGNSVTTAIIPFDKDSFLVGTSKGLYFVNKAYEARPVSQSPFFNSYILCLAKQNGNIWIGTTDKGVINWNYATKQIINYTTANGLPSNFIYSIYVSPEQKAWIGTGFGISNLQLNKQLEVVAVKNYGRSDGLLGMECSHNCLLRAADSSLWFGTTKGLFHFNPYPDISEKNVPMVHLKSVKLFSSPITDSSLFSSTQTWFNVPENLVLGPKQNHITFELGSIYFTNPEDEQYKYKMLGIDKDYITGSNPELIYPALPPGKYTLVVNGLTKNGLLSTNQVEYSFEIKKAFYQTRFFQLMVVIMLLVTGGLIAYVLTRGRQKRKQRAKELLEKIREEEFLKLRQRTAEDFHDEMGNNLTRISVLTDVLKSKINPEEKDLSKIVQQIKENTTLLYNGSRDIIWSLNSQNDGLFEVTEHIRDIGNELFNDTNIDFNFTHNISSYNTLKLKLDYSRNLTMIFKEAYSNIVKYSGAGKVSLIFDLKPNNHLSIELADNGVGFDPKTTHSGNGLKNMENRVKRLQGQLQLVTGSGEGTQFQFQFNNLFT